MSGRYESDPISSLTSSEETPWLLDPWKRVKGIPEGREDLTPLKCWVLGWILVEGLKGPCAPWHPGRFLPSR